MSDHPKIQANTSPKRPSYLKILSSNRALRALWIGQVVSNSGDSVFDLAVLWLVLIKTNSLLLVGLTQAAILLPTVFVRPVAGVYADRLNRRDIMLLSNIVEGIITAAISLSYFLGMLKFFPLVIILVVLLFSAYQFFNAAVNAILPRLVEISDLGAANSLFSLSTTANQLTSYTFGGIIVAVVGVLAPITYDSFSFFFAAIMITFIAKSYGKVGDRVSFASKSPASGHSDNPSSSIGVELNPSKEQQKDSESPMKTNFRREFVEGLRYIKSNTILVELIVIALVVNCVGGGISALTAPYSAEWLHGNASTYGFVLASTSLGILAGTFVVGKLNFRSYVGKLFFSGLLSAGITLALIGLSRNTLISVGLFFIFGVTIQMANLPLFAFIQARIPNEILGRATSSFAALLAITQPIGAAVSGQLATLLSSVGLLFTMYGILVAVTISLGYFAFKEIREAAY